MCLGVPGSRGSLRGRITGSQVVRGSFVGSASWGLSGGRKRGKTIRARVFIEVSAEGTGEAGQTDLGLANLNNFIGLWDVGTALNRLGPGLGVITTGEYWLLPNRGIMHVGVRTGACLLSLGIG